MLLKYMDIINNTATDVNSLEFRERLARFLLEPLYNNPRQIAAVKDISNNKYTAITGTRRSTKTYGVSSYAGAKVVMNDDYKIQILTNRLKSPTANWIKELIKRFRSQGLLLQTHIKAYKPQNSYVNLTFPWGSEINVFDVAHADAFQDKRGDAPNLVWCDEAQHVKTLPEVMNDLIIPTLADRKGKVVFSGTPGVELDSYYGQIALGNNPDWVNHYMGMWMNPRYGKTFDERWQHIITEMIHPSRTNAGLSPNDLQRIKSLTEDQLNSLLIQYIPPELSWIKDLNRSVQREIFGLWVSDRGQLVFPWRDDIYWSDKPFKSLKDAIDNLPKINNRWNAVVGIDFGFHPDPAAWVVAVWAENHPTGYVIYSYTEHRLTDSQILAKTIDLLDELKHYGLNLFKVVADLDGARTGTRHDWNPVLQARFGILLPPPQKSHKEEDIRVMGLDISGDRIKFIKNTPIDIEGKHLRWREDKEQTIDKHRSVTLSDGRTIVPGDHCLDALRYIYPYLHMFGQPQPDTRTPEEKMQDHVNSILFDDENSEF